MVRTPRLLPTVVLLLCALLALPAAASADRDKRAKRAKRGAECTDTNVIPAAGNLAAVRAAVLCLHNRERTARGLPALKEQPQLRRAAEGHSRHMVAADFFAHDAPGGRDMASRILDTGYGKGRGWSLGENIAYGTGELATAAEIHDAWMRSPGHRANILRRQFREIGIGIALGVPDADVDDGATYTADFGVRR